MVSMNVLCNTGAAIGTFVGILDVGGTADEDEDVAAELPIKIDLAAAAPKTGDAGA